MSARLPVPSHPVDMVLCQPIPLFFVHVVQSVKVFPRGFTIPEPDSFVQGVQNMSRLILCRADRSGRDLSRCRRDRFGTCPAVRIVSHSMPVSRFRTGRHEHLRRAPYTSTCRCFPLCNDRLLHVYSIRSRFMSVLRRLECSVFDSTVFVDALCLE